MSPAVRRVYERFFTGGLILAAMMEDLPYRGQPRAAIRAARAPTAASGCGFNTVCTQERLERHAAFLRLFKETLKPFRTRGLGSGKENSNMGHVCGTCRFGTDPTTSVLDAQNRAHEVDNLYVVDTSFFPSSAGLNPSLTVAANALRVAAHVNQAHFAT